MSSRIKYRIIAAFFLTVFSLSTVVGFGCSIGIDMGYNTKHHEHEDDKPETHAKPHSHGVVNHHEQHQESSSSSLSNIKSGVDCCAADVTSFNSLDKSLSNIDFLIPAPIFLLSFTSIFLFQNDFSVPQRNHYYHTLQRWRALDHTDIRIAIQSFQI